MHLWLCLLDVSKTPRVYSERSHEVWPSEKSWAGNTQGHRRRGGGLLERGWCCEVFPILARRSVGWNVQRCKSDIILGPVGVRFPHNWKTAVGRWMNQFPREGDGKTHLDRRPKQRLLASRWWTPIHPAWVAHTFEQWRDNQGSNAPRDTTTEAYTKRRRKWLQNQNSNHNYLGKQKDTISPISETCPAYHQASRGRRSRPWRHTWASKHTKSEWERKPLRQRVRGTIF